MVMHTIYGRGALLHWVLLMRVFLGNGTAKYNRIFHGRREAESAIQQRFHPRMLIVLGATVAPLAETFFGITSSISNQAFSGNCKITKYFRCATSVQMPAKFANIYLRLRAKFALVYFPSVSVNFSKALQCISAYLQI